MAERTIQIDGVKYLIRGNYTPAQIRQRYEAFKAKYPRTTLTLAQWANRGAIYKRVK
jgi:hypothetical protein